MNTGRPLLLTLILLTLFPASIAAQGIVRGKITCTNPHTEVTAATILVRGTAPLVYTTMEEDGTFVLKAPEGRQTIEVRSVGFVGREYAVTVIPTRETVLEVALEPADQTLSEVVVEAPYDKSRTLEPMSLAGGRSFSTDETYRFASALGDPARMVRSFAGVMPVNDSRNDIIIRGNSPSGLQWILDGIEVPNPNHFNAGIGLTGGQVSMVNTNLLTNSDFLLSAWPAAYGNALSGVFDLKMREGNTKTHEGWAQAGYGGYELGAEGPIPTGNGSNYLVAYRYSVPAVLSGLKLIKIPAVPHYQDLTSKVTLRLSPDHSLSLLGLWGKSRIKIDMRKMTETLNKEEGIGDARNTIIDMSSMNIVLGATHRADWSKTVYGSTTISLVRTVLDLALHDQKEGKKEQLDLMMKDRSRENKLSLRSELTWHPSFASMIVAGIGGDLFDVDYFSESPAFTDLGEVNEQGRFGLLRFYGQYRYKPSQKWAATVGLHGMGTTINKSRALEPRAGVMFQPAPSHTLGMATGLYSQLQPRTYYFTRDPETGNDDNRRLGLSRAFHADLYYDWAFARDWHVRIEGYWQHLYKIPVKDDPDSSLTILDVGVTSDNSINPTPGLVNKGTGRNYGVELTLEKFISQNYYLLTNLTLFSSTYTNGFTNQRWHTAMDGGYIFNLSGGGEYPLNEKWTLLADLKCTAGGGKRYSPLLEAESLDAGEMRIDVAKTNTLQMRPYFRGDVRLGYRLTGKKNTQELAIDLQNITNRRNVMGLSYDSKTNDYKEVLLTGFGIMATWRINFTLK